MKLLGLKDKSKVALKFRGEVFNEVIGGEVFSYSLQLYLNETSTQVLSGEYCEIFTSSFFYRKPPVTSVDLLFLMKTKLDGCY